MHGTPKAIRASAVIAIGLLLALAATVGPLPAPTGEPGASLRIRVPDAVQALVLALFALAIVLLLALQRRRRPSEDEPLPAGTEPRRPAWAALLPFLVLLVAVWYLVWNRGSGEGGHPVEGAFAAIAGLLDFLALARKPPTSVPFFDFTIAVLLLLLALTVFAVMVVVALAPRLERWWAARGAAEATPPRSARPADRLGDPRAEPDPRLAIIRAYGHFEHALAAARAPRVPCQTPTEFMRTTLARLPLPVSPVARLTALFEIARFSDRPVDADARDTACDCLAIVLERLAGLERGWAVSEGGGSAPRSTERER